MPSAVDAFGIDALLGAAANLGQYAYPCWTMEICSLCVADADRSGSARFQCCQFVCALATDDCDRFDYTDTAAATVQNAVAYPPLEPVLP